MSEPATSKQIEYIKALGGIPKKNLTKVSASELIEKLRSKAPATKKQLDYLKRLGASIPKSLSAQKASELIEKLDGEQPPTKSLANQITELGGTVPKTKREAEALFNSLITTARATASQQQRAAELGFELPDGISFLDANELLSEKEMDNDPEEGKPATKAQLNKIVKLGGNPEQAVNRWRADDYIERLEEKEEEFEERIEEAIEWTFGDADSREMMSVKKPSKAVMRKALRYGDAQGWGENWEDPGRDSEYNPYTLMDVAIYSVAPELLKEGESVPALQRSSSNQSKGKGCLSIILVAAGGSLAFSWLVVWVIMKIG
jgi:hypothetical protein